VNSNLRLILSTVFFIFAAQTMISILVPLAAAEIGLDAWSIGVLAALPLAVGLLSDIPLAKASDVLGRRPILVSSSIVGGIAVALFLGDMPVLGFAVGCILFGLFLSMAMIPSLAFLTETVDHTNDVRVQGINGAIQGLSALIGAFLVGSIWAELGTKAAFLSVGVAVVAVGAFARFLPERPRARTLPNRSEAVRDLVRSYAGALRLLRGEPTLLVAGIAASLFGFQFLILGNTFVPLFLIGAGDYSSADVGLLLGMRSLVGAGLGLVFASVVTRLGLIQCLVLSSVAGFAGIGLVPILASSPALPLAFASQGIGLAFTAASVNLLVASVTSDCDRALGLSAAVLVARINGVALPLAMGAVVSMGGWATFFVVAEVVGAIMIGAISVLGRRATPVMLQRGPAA
jgi:MFS family permease